MKKLILPAAICLLMSGQASAEPLPVSLNDAVENALITNEDISVANLNVQKVKEIIKEAKSAAWFTSNLTGSYQYATLSQDKNPDIDSYQSSLGLSLVQPIYTFGLISNAIDAAEISEQMTEYQRVQYVRELEYNTKIAYYSALAADTQLDIAQKSYDNAVKSKKLLQDSSSARASQSDLIKVSSDIATRKPEVDKARVARDKAYRLLKIIGGYESEDIVLTDSLDFTTEGAESLPNGDIQSKIKNNPSINMLAEKVKMHETLAKVKDAEYMPKISAFAGYETSSAGLEYNDLPDSAKNGYVGVKITVPLSDGGRASAQAAQERIDANIARESLSKSRRYMEKDLIDATERYNSYIEIFKQEKEAIKLAEKSYEMSLSRFRMGQTSAVELNDVERGLSGLRLAHTGTVFNIYEAASALEKITGEKI